MTWPTTKGLQPCIDPAALRAFLQDELPKQWGCRVDERMQALDIRNAQVAVLAGTTPQTIVKVRTGEIAPRDYLRITIAAALRTTPERLFPMPNLFELEKILALRAKKVA